MLRTLLESEARVPRRRAGLVASVAIHTLVIGGALAATASARARGGRDTPALPPVIHYRLQEPAPRSRMPNRESSRRTEGTATYPEPPQELGRIITYVPDLDARNRVDVDLAQRIGVDTGVTVCLARCTSGPGGDSTRSFDGAPATLATVDRGAALVSPLRPQYPERLRAAGVTGRVVVRLVVDTLGRVEPASVVIRESAHDLFAQAVRAVIPSLRFVPAEAGGRRVRMLVDLPFEFRLND